MFTRTASIAKLSINGPLTLSKQFQLLKTINLLYSRNYTAISVHINSYGGTLRSAKQISDALKKYRHETQYMLKSNVRNPVFCFAEDYCINSANLILTSATKCFISRFSVVGDFGFHGGYLQQQLQNPIRYVWIIQNNPNFINIGKIKKKYQLSNYSCTIGDIKQSDQFLIRPLTVPPIPSQSVVNLGPADTVLLNSKDKMKEMVDMQTEQLKGEIVRNRGKSIELMTKQRGNAMSKLQQMISKCKDGIVDPDEAVEYGLVDGIQIYENYYRKLYGKFKIHDFNGELFEYQTLNALTRMFQSIGPKDW